MGNYYVQIIRYTDDGVVEEMGPFSERRADRVDDGANWNLNHEEFYTLITQKPEEEDNA